MANALTAQSLVAKIHQDRSDASQLQLCLNQGSTNVYKLNTCRISHRLARRTRRNFRHWKGSSPSGRNGQTSNQTPSSGASSQRSSWIVECRRSSRTLRWSLPLHTIDSRGSVSRQSYRGAPEEFLSAYGIARLQHNHRCNQPTRKPFRSVGSPGTPGCNSGLYFDQHHRNLHGHFAWRSDSHLAFLSFARILLRHPRRCKASGRALFKMEKTRPNTSPCGSHDCGGLYRQRIAAFYREQKTLPDGGIATLFTCSLRSAA